MEIEPANRIDIDHEMKQAYLDYAMSVIIARALPDARDGLKPVQRRILYSMYDMGMRSNSEYKKSARIVGEVLGKYHPHGDSAVYEAMARMAQDFTMRSLLIDGQGNFGSVDGDPPAAMRYTEARLAPPALDLLLDINKDTVDFIDNFDGTLQEPIVLPASIPNLLVNGTTGIAVGMATSIPPHNLGEVIDALVYMLQHWEKMDNISVSQLMQFIQGPDFPTGGIILEEKSQENIIAAYGSGRGRVSIQARVHSEEMERGKSRLIITELPYMVNKSTLIERIAELAREGHLEGISDLRDESDRNGMRIVIELTKNMDPNAVLTDLYRRTPLQTTFSIIMLALVDGEPRTLTLKQALRVYLEHRLEVIKRRTEFDLERARQRAHILQGLLIALNNLDAVIQLIKKSADVDVAKTRLMKQFKLTDLQADAILEMQLRRLAALERKKIETEHKDLLLKIKELEHLLKSPKLIRAVAADELVKIKEAYAEKRRTQIVLFKPGKMKQFTMESAHQINEKPCWIGLSREGLISRTVDEKLPRMSGNEAPRLLAKALSTDTLYLASSNGATAAIAVHTLPETEKLSEGLPFFKATPLKETDQPVAMFVLPSNRKLLSEEAFILTISRGGLVKKSQVNSLPGPSAQTFILTKVNEGDSLGWAYLTDGQRELLLASSLGYSIRFSEEDVRAMGLIAAGVNGIKLAVGDLVIGAETLPGQGEVFLMCSDGNAKRVDVSDFPKQGRFGKGVIAWDLSTGTRLVGMALGKGNTVISGHLFKAAAKSFRLDEAPIRKRSATRGETVIELKPGDSVAGLTIPHFLDRESVLKTNGGNSSSRKTKIANGKRKSSSK